MTALPTIAGAGAGALGGSLPGLLGLLDLPRQTLWGALGLPETGAGLVSGLTGLDEDDPWAQALGVGAEVLGDPLTLAGGLAGGAAGRGLGRAAAALPARLGLMDELAHAQKLAGAAEGALANYRSGLAAGAAAPRAPMAALADDIAGTLAAGPRSAYRPEVMDFLDRAAAAGGKGPPIRTFNRVRPDVAEALDAIGAGSRLPGGGLQVMGRPPLRGRGGVMFFSDPFDPALRIKSYEDTLTTLGPAPRAAPGGPAVPTLAAFEPQHPLLGELVPVGGEAVPLGGLPLDRAALAARAQAASLGEQLRSMGDPDVWTRALMLMRGY